MTNKVAFINGKGGCGKSTSIFHVAGVLANKGEKVLVIDLDKQRNTTKFLLMENEQGVKKTMYDYMAGDATVDEITRQALFRSRGNAKPKYYGVDVLPSDKRFEDEGTLRNLEIDIKEDLGYYIKENDYKWVLVDMPPSNRALNEICFTQIVDSVIAPFSSDLFSVDGYSDLMEIVNEARNMNEELKILGVYLARYDSQCGVDRFIREQLLAFDTFIDVQIPLMSDVRESIMFARPLSYYKAVSKSRTAYEKLVEVMEKKIRSME